MFLCIDGLDGSGKSTAAETLLEKMKASGAVEDAAMRHLPAKSLEEITAFAAHPSARAFAYIADMADALNEDMPFISSPTRWMIWDRGIFSTMVYQIPAMGITNLCEQERTARALHENFMLAVHSAFRAYGVNESYYSEFTNAYVLLDTPVGLCMQRAKARGTTDTYEQAEREIWEKRAKDYWRYFNLFGKQIVNTTGKSANVVADEIFKNLRLYTRGM